MLLLRERKDDVVPVKLSTRTGTLIDMMYVLSTSCYHQRPIVGPRSIHQQNDDDDNQNSSSSSNHYSVTLTGSCWCPSLPLPNSP
ncbi:hypothetical protein CB1_001509004 [Camelus ferus]|nr:hypothetical protein CB1_001509004 [Camelus ferus]